MVDESWKEEYKEMKLLKPIQVKLLDEGANSLSQTWLLNSMWSDWKELKEKIDMKRNTDAKSTNKQIMDPWD